MLSFAWEDWERKASNFPPEVAFQLYSFHWLIVTTVICIWQLTRMQVLGKAIQYACSYSVLIDQMSLIISHDNTHSS